MEFVTCALCKADDAEPFLALRDLGSGLPGEFNLVRCRQCRLLYLNPRPSPREMAAYYPRDYRPYKRAIADERWALMRWMRQRNIRRRRRAAERHAHRVPGQVLDVGCSTGIFLAEMEDAGWRGTGIETNQSAAAYARERLGLEVLGETLEQAELPGGSFDLITFWDVLEHMHDPLATLSHVHDLLQPGGIVVATVPNYRSLDRKLFGSAWIGFDAPRHLTVFAPDTLRRLLEQAGLDIVVLRCDFGGFFSFVASLRHWANATLPWPSMRKVLASATELPGLRLPTEPFFAVIDRTGWGSELAVVARKAARQ
jgi:SAM-dependent methyltransferase